jgi:hypothetical protein
MHTPIFRKRQRVRLSNSFNISHFFCFAAKTQRLRCSITMLRHLPLSFWGKVRPTRVVSSSEESATKRYAQQTFDF